MYSSDYGLRTINNKFKILFIGLISSLFLFTGLSLKTVYAGGTTPTPSVTDPSAPVTVGVSSYTVEGDTGNSSGTVTIYKDANNNGAVDSPDDTVVGSTSSITGNHFSVPVTLELGDNNFVVIHEASGKDPSITVNVPTITYAVDTTPPPAPTDLHFTQGSNTLDCGAITGADGIYSTHLLWSLPDGQTQTEWKVTPTYPSGSHGTPYSWTTGTDAWIGANIGQGYGASPNDQGTYAYSVQYKGSNGVWSDPATCSLVYDSVAPVVTVTPAAGSLLHGTVTFTITVQDDNLDPTILHHIWSYLYNSAPPQKLKGANVDLSSGTGTLTVDTTQIDDGDAILDVGKLYDAAGNPSGTGDTYFRHYTIDNTAPTVTFTSPSSGATVNNLKIGVDMDGTGSNLIEYGFDVTGPSGVHFSTANYSVNQPSITLTDFDLCAAAHYGSCPSTLPSGTYTVRAKAYDAAGNRNISTHISFVVDAKPPPIPTLYRPADGSLIRGSDATLKWNGVTDPEGNGPVTYQYESSLTSTVDPTTKALTSLRYGPASTGTNTQIDATHSADSTYYWQVRACDSLGNCSNWSGPWKVTIDSTKPNVSDFRIDNNPLPTVFAKQIDVSALASDVHLSTVTFYVTSPEEVRNGLPFCTGNGTHLIEALGTLNGGRYEASLDTSTLNGPYCLSVVAEDGATNHSVPVGRQLVTVDNTAPTAPNITKPTAEQYFNTAPILNQWDPATDANGINHYQIAYLYDDLHTFGGSTCPGVQISGQTLSGCRDVNGTSRNHSPATGEQGGVTIYVRAIDNAGNIGDWSAPVHYYYDATAPSTPVNGLPNNTYELDNEFDFTWDTSTDNVGPIKYEYQASQNPAESGGVLTTGLWHSGTLNTNMIHSSGAADGVWYWQVRAKDAAGNYSPWSEIWHMTIDSVAPVEPDATPPAGNYTGTQSVELTSSDSGSGLAGIYYTTDGSDPNNTGNGTLYTGPISITVDTTLKAIAYDNAGNSSSILTADYGIAPVIDGEQAILATTSTITITWTTNQPATSRVIYDTVPHSTLGSPPNYGYAHSTVEDSTKVTHHSVIVSGLVSGTTYYFRTVSHGSPESVSDQISGNTRKASSGGGSSGFSTSNQSTNNSGDTNQGNTAGGQSFAFNTTGANNSNDGNNNSNDDSDVKSAAAGVSNDSTTNNSQNDQTAASKNWWWLLLLLLIPAYYFWRRSKQNHENV
ncbi:MAG TPA: chitobiase/beta-hexosaminidase C-terminal domain-containing protein [Candidatus Saccharimonadales bacterium]|nr:chitobiase/beta-hexosaminidase C-terminal domain-containing protein [Candidatus Saccharimonadales bacterium]